MYVKQMQILTLTEDATSIECTRTDDGMMSVRIIQLCNVVLFEGSLPSCLLTVHSYIT